MLGAGIKEDRLLHVGRILAVDVAVYSTHEDCQPRSKIDRHGKHVCQVADRWVTYKPLLGSMSPLMACPRDDPNQVRGVERLDYHSPNVLIREIQETAQRSQSPPLSSC